MERKQDVDLVLLNVIPPNGGKIDAIAVKEGRIIALGTIPFIFSNFKGKLLFNGQGNQIYKLSKGNSDYRIAQAEKQIFHEKDQANLVLISSDNILIAHWNKNQQIYLDNTLLDPEWDDH